MGANVVEVRGWLLQWRKPDRHRALNPKGRKAATEYAAKEAPPEKRMKWGCG